MIIKSITLENFRQYKGKNIVEFSTDREKNVTVILGINTSGKTTLIQAFKWCLYEISDFKTRDELLNIEMSNGLPYNGEAMVGVKIILLHENKEYTVSRTQKFTKLMNIKKLRCDKSSFSVSYKEHNGNTYSIPSYECGNTINKILPVGLSDYFFFDGERIQDINNKKDVVAAVQGLMGLDVAKVAVEHLDPNKTTSVIRKLNNELNLGSDQDSQQLHNKLDNATEKLNQHKERLANIKDEIEYQKSEKFRLEELLRGMADVKDLQQRRDKTEARLNGAKSTIIGAQDRITSDLDRDYFAFFVRPLLDRVKKVLDSADKQVEGIPEMNAKSIEYIFARGRCICGCDLTKNQGAVENIEYEKSLLPPQNIGTMIRTFNETCNEWIAESERRNLKEQITNDYKNLRQAERACGEYEDELKSIREQIKKIGDANVTKIENEKHDVENILHAKLNQKGSLETEIKYLDGTIEDLKRKINNLAAQCSKNNLIRREIEYATAIYEWFKESYDKKEKKVKQDLLESVNNIFEKMYHGSRNVTIDDNYRIQLITNVGDEKATTDESKGLEAVKNFSFISGLVDLARKAANGSGDNGINGEGDIFKTEPYPIVMDAPFSNVDEIHIKNISKILPDIAEQVILIIMEKDWAYAQGTMGDKVGASYRIEKVDNSDTYSTIRRV